MQRKSGKFVCQCPLGLKLLRGNGHKNKKSRRFQCPLGLIPHFYQDRRMDTDLGHHHLFQCPLGLIPHFYRTHVYIQETKYSGVSMPSRTYTSFLPYWEKRVIYEIFRCQCPHGLELLHVRNLHTYRSG